MKVTKYQLEEAKKEIREETEHNCKACNVERNITGLYYCDYHKSVIKFMKTWTTE